MTDYRITPVKHWNNNWAWWATRSFDYGGDTPTFYIGTASHYNLAAGERLAVWGTAADTDNWNDFTTVTIGTPDITITHGSAFPAGLIYVAALPMYPFSRVQRKVQEWMATDYVTDTTSSTNGIIGYMTARTVPDNSGRTAPALPLYGFKISKGAGTKNTIILTALNHGSETPGAFMLEGAVDWLLAGGTQAEGLLDYSNFLVYPCLNPQGVWSGYFRSNPQGPTYDHNRKYNDGSSGVLEDVDALKAAIIADAAGVDAFFDCHSYMADNVRFGNCINASDAAHIAYRDAVRVYDAAWYLSTSAVTDGLKDFVNDTFAPVLVFAPEHGGALTEDVADYITYGVNLMRGLADFVVAGGLPYGP